MFHALFNSDSIWIKDVGDFDGPLFEFVMDKFSAMTPSLEESGAWDADLSPSDLDVICLFTGGANGSGN